jgi:hypothetical protein
LIIEASAANSAVVINTENGSWTFGADGSLTLPQAGAINSESGIILTTNRGTLVIGTDMETPGVAQHFHIAFDGSNSMPSSNDLFLGDDYNYFKLPGTLQDDFGAEIRTNNRIGGNSYNWRFDTDGDLTLPEGGDIYAQAGSGASLLSDQNAEIGYVDPDIYAGDPFVPAPGKLLVAYVGADSDGVYMFTGKENEASVWAVDSEGNLVTERFNNDSDLPSGDIVDQDGNSIIRAAISTTAPGAWAKEGHQWYNTEDGRTYIKVNNTWVDANPPVVAPVSTYLSGLTIEEQTISPVDYTDPNVKIAGNLLPDEDLSYDLGSITNQWSSLYIKSSTIYMSGRAVSLTDEGLKVDGQAPVTVLDGGHADTWLLPV